MARINIEECWWTDPRRNALVRLLGKPELVDGIAIHAWRLGQEFWKHDRQLVPKHLFDLLEGASELIQVGLAEVREEGVYIRGSSAYLEWVIDKREAGRAGGVKSAKRRRDAKGKLLKSSQAESKQSPSRVQAESKQIQPSPSPSSSSSEFSSLVSNSSSDPDLNTNTSFASQRESQQQQAADCLPAVRKKDRFSEETRKKMRVFIASYAKGYREKYKGAPEGIRNQALIGQIGNWIQHVSEVRAISLVEVYLQISYRPFDESCHDLSQFLRHLNRIGLAVDTGNDGSSTDWSKVFGAKTA